MVALFEHNQKAYDSAAKMLSQTGKAAIIHPTGTGKSYIAWKFCEDHPEWRVCWLSPSEYIFQTQVENFQKAGSELPQNIRFYTYAKLMKMDEAALLAIQPELIILDEFHRCGAKLWGAGVGRLLELYPEAKVLGLSATNIRYLDHNRDMAMELFDGNIASEMTLGESIVSGILNAPVYVLALFNVQKELEKYEARAARVSNPQMADRAARYLEALRRALDQADGLEIIFKKHMRVPRGKYLVFCANKAHMLEMMSYAQAWFGEMDPEMHLYSVTFDDPLSGKSFQAFKGDDSDHLRLLYCIDSLNEGIHVDGIDGVILLRPTVSPIVYKQQIGRALASGCDQSSVIFDIVMNVENLTGISAVEDEMALAQSYFLGLGEDGLIVNERFKVLDTLKDCRALFSQLDAVLSVSWDQMFEQAAVYAKAHGNLLVPKTQRTPEGYPLGNWIANQRKVRDGRIQGRLTDEQIARLDGIGMVWGPVRDVSFAHHFALAEAYYAEHGDLAVPCQYIAEDGTALGNWIRYLRRMRKNGNLSLSEDQIGQLDAMGMVWDMSVARWEAYYRACVAYVAAHGNLDVPSDYVTSDRLALGRWLDRLRLDDARGVLDLSEEQVMQLNALGMNWEPRSKRAWQQGYQAAKAYVAAHGNLDVPAAFVTETGYPLGRWLAQQRMARSLSEHRRELLSEIGMVWEKPDVWNKHFTAAQVWFEEHGDLKVPANGMVGSVWLGRWIREQRLIYQGKKPGKSLTEEQIGQLNAIGMVWQEIRQERSQKSGCSNQDAWEKGFAHAVEYGQAVGDLLVPRAFVAEDGFKLGLWINNQRCKFRRGEMDAEQVRRFEAIGMIWEPQVYLWMMGFDHLKDYLSVNDALPKTHFVTSDGFELGDWVRTQRLSYARGKMPDDRVRLLHEVGIGF